MHHLILAITGMAIIHSTPLNLIVAINSRKERNLFDYFRVCSKRHKNSNRVIQTKYFGPHKR